MNKTQPSATTPAAIYLVLLPAFALWRGFVLSALWGWFVAPLAGHAIGVLHGAGLCFTWSFLTTGFVAPKKKQTPDAGELWTSFVGTILAPLLALAAGWLAHYWM